MSLAPQFKALFKKNLILMKRNIFSSLCLFVFPIILFICIYLIRNAISSDDILIGNERAFTKQMSIIYPKDKLKYNDFSQKDPLENCKNGQRFTYALIKGESSIDLKIKSTIQYASETIKMNIKEFDNEAQVIDYFKNESYGVSEKKICFAVGIVKISKNQYEIILKYSSPIKDGLPADKSFYLDIPSTLNLRLDPFQSTPQNENYMKWQNSGYLYMINQLNNIILDESMDSAPTITGGVVPMIYPKYQKDDLGLILSFLVPFFLIVIYTIPLIIFVYRMVRDKELRVKEGMRIMGMRDLAYFLSYLLQYLIINLIIALLGSAIMEGPLPHIHFGLRFGMLFLYGLSVFGLIYIFQAIIDQTTMAIILSILIYYVIYFISPAVLENDVSRTTKLVASLLSPVCLGLGFLTMSQFELSRIYISGHEGYQFFGYSSYDMILFLSIDFIIYMIIGFYLENVVPQQYGTSKPWYFLFTKKFWIGSSSGESELKEELLMNEFNPNTDNFQDESSYTSELKDSDILKIRNIYKTFGDGKKALNGVSLNLYKNEIFALLGHNGAGKSTLINILSGLYQSTNGQVLYNNQDMLQNLDLFRKKIGICPQHDVLFTDLTVREHLELFANFKGVSGENIDSEINSILSNLEMSNKSNDYSQNLSGGQKRKLSIAIALIGGSEIVFLDEPTSGMDITSRRNLWDILKKFTTDRIIILTTHYMEEANVLGKRIGILSGGQMKCTGTPLFLIDKFGQNISLTLVKNYSKSEDESNLDSKVISKIKEIYSKNSSSNLPLEFEVLSEEILIRIPKNSNLNKVNYKKFFEELDFNLESLKLKNYSAAMPTIEDVFLLISDEIKKGQRKIEDLSNADEGLPEKRRLSNNFADYSPENFKQNGELNKFFTNLCSTLIKRWIQSLRNLKVFILEIVCPILLVLVGLALSGVQFISDPPKINLTVEGYKFKQNILVNKDIKSYNNWMKFEVEKVEESNIFDSIIEFNKAIQAKYKSTEVDPINRVFNDEKQNSNLGSYYFTEYSSTNIEFFTYVNMKTNDGAPTFLHAMYENIIRDTLNDPTFKISINNFPFPLTIFETGKSQTRNSSNLVFFSGIAFALIPASFVTYIIREKNTTKHLQVISGISYLSYWLANFLFELVKYYFTGGVILLLIYVFNKNQPYLWLLYLLMGPTMIVCTYLFSFLFSDESSAQNFTIGINFILGSLAGSFIVLLRFIKSLNVVAKIIGYVLRVFPVFAFCNGFNVLLNKQVLFYIDNPDAKFYEEINVLDLEYVGSDLLYLGCFFILYFTLILITENFRSKWAIGKFQPNQPNVSNINDEEVKKEIIKANQIKDEENRINNYSIIVKNVEKTYGSCFEKPNKATNNISFTLEYGDCFAMLGVNGAGKSTMFKCLTNQELPEKGDIIINGKSISSNFDECRNQIGYCPQQDAIFDELTVKENLEFYSSIKGIPSKIKQSIIDSLIKDLNLTEFINKQSGNLSGGNKRKLSVAIAMIGNPPIILLDEPSAGMDPEARRFMWAVIHKITKQRKKSSVILTTHSMEEAETLCQKLAIMVKGQFKCFGSSTVIKNTYGKGYEILLTISPSQKNLKSDETVSYETVSDALIKLNSKLNPKIINKGEIGVELYDLFDRNGSININRLIQWEHSISSIYSIISRLLDSFEEVEITEYWENTYQLKINKKDGITIGYLFGLLDEIKQDFNVSEYSITQTSMEQIFNNFANMESQEIESTTESEVESSHKPVLTITKEVIKANYSVIS